MIDEVGLLPGWNVNSPTGSVPESTRKCLNTWRVEMTTEDLMQIKSLLGDLRWIQAAAMVGSRMNEHKDSISYMRNLARLIDLIDAEIKK